jgi:hypothetical protein
MNFNKFKEAIQAQFAIMKDHKLFTTSIEKEFLWQSYLKAFPEGTNPMFRERTEHDCQVCKQFIRNVGSMVAINPSTYSLISLWDAPNIPEEYQPVATAMSKLVKHYAIRNRFFHFETNVGFDHNIKFLEDETYERYDHFHIVLPSTLVKQDPGSTLGAITATKEVFERGLKEITTDAINTVIELVEQGSLYRGEEHLPTVNKFKILHEEYQEHPIENFCWAHADTQGARIRNTAIGTLLTDLSTGTPLEASVKAFEVKVAPTNYKRPTALITKSMIDNAQKKVVELGIGSSLHRRYATINDITINNIIFADRTAKKEMNVFDTLAAHLPDTKQNFDKVEEVSIDTFINDILPKSTSLEVMVENKHVNNMVSLIAPSFPLSKNIFQWDNNFTWTYEGDVTDSIKERVKTAGGNVKGVLRCSLGWYNYDDLDIHVMEPGGREIYYSNSRSPTGGELDVDMNAGGKGTRTPVENITWPKLSKMKEGEYHVFVNNYCKRESVDVGFEAEIEYNNQVYTFSYAQAVGNRKNVTVAKFEFSRENGLTFKESLPSTQASKESWGITTQKFHRVSMVMNSPNHWDNKTQGNKHYFFMIEDCLNPDKARGFYNEFLSPSLMEHRKVFEVLGSKMMTEPSDDQLSGLGFSSTVRNTIVVKVTGAFARTVKVLI